MLTVTQPPDVTKSVAPATRIPTSSPAVLKTPLPLLPAKESKFATNRYDPSGDWFHTFATCAPAYFRGNPDGCPIYSKQGSQVRWAHNRKPPKHPHHHDVFALGNKSRPAAPGREKR